MNLGKEDAEKLLKYRETSFNKGLTVAEQSRIVKLNQMHQEITSDPEFVGEKGVATFKQIGRALDYFGDDNIKNLLTDPEYGNNVHLAKFLKKVGEALGPDTSAPAGKGAFAAQGNDQNKGLKEAYPDFFKDK